MRLAVDADTGVVLQRLAYDAYGRQTLNSNPGLQPFGFKGALSDPVAEGAGLVWMGVRAYLPSIARFATPDPVGLAAGWNEHDAFAGDPINLSDVDGRWPSRNQIVDFSAGFGDAALSVFCLLLCNPGAAARDWLDIDDMVDMCSGSYTFGNIAGTVVVTVATAGAGAAAGAGGRAVAKTATRILDDLNGPRKPVWRGEQVETGRSPSQARKDFDEITGGQSRTPDKSPDVKTGTVQNGKHKGDKAVLRKDSGGGRTIEIQHRDGQKTKYRYP